MGIPSVIELLILIIIGIFVWLFFKKNKKKIEKPSVDNNRKPKSTKTKFCSECGAPLDEDALFCAECGAKVEDIKTYRKKSPINKEPR